jgi:hypothetical protein
MTNHHFISYSTKDAKEFALKLCDKLKAGPPSIPAWLDKREIKPGMDWDDQVVEAIRTGESVIFVMSKDSVRMRSICKAEWCRALKYKNPAIPILPEKGKILPLGTIFEFLFKNTSFIISAHELHEFSRNFFSIYSR